MGSPSIADRVTMGAKEEAPTATQKREPNGVDVSLNAMGFAMGVKEGIIEGGAALSHRINISSVNDVSIIQTYGSAGAKYLKISKGLGVIGSVITTGYSMAEVSSQYAEGGLHNVLAHRDVVDAGVGKIGLTATAFAALGFISNPIGWGIGAGVLIYGGATMIYDAAKQP
jgi:hypothetical protein